MRHPSIRWNLPPCRPHRHVKISSSHAALPSIGCLPVTCLCWVLSVRTHVLSTNHEFDGAAETRGQNVCTGSDRLLISASVFGDKDERFGMYGRSSLTCMHMLAHQPRNIFHDLISGMYHAFVCKILLHMLNNLPCYNLEIFSMI